MAASKLESGSNKLAADDKALSVWHAARIGRILWSAGALGILYCFAVGCLMLHARGVAEDNFRVVANVTSKNLQLKSSNPEGFFLSARNRPEVVGRVEIPAVGLVTALLAGDDSMSLTEGAGHIPGTAEPGGLGTVGIAGHRDTHFKLLAKVVPGMEVRLVGQSGVYRYRVTSSEIVLPEDVKVLNIGDVPSLVLVTCYPFRFIGHAPKRFIVHSSLISADPDPGF